MTGENRKTPLKGLKAALGDAWRDHHHARDQTWKALQIEVVLGAGLVTVDAQFHLLTSTLAAGVLVIAAAIFGILISLHHRKLEIMKFIHIINCEEELGLHRDDLIPLRDDCIENFGLDMVSYKQRVVRNVDEDCVRKSAVGIPEEIRIFDIFKLSKRSTSIFIIRMHIVIIFFAILLIFSRIYTNLSG